ncbi:c-type cytochrome [Tunturibacter empetritectus]|uniref:Glucose dehydrogenase n=1 Tax=Tunturiibacter empetritectus TaxID=3069691 RepID=A0A7W8IL92_9BACT|nr:c-type cytochrome [Edaphobacter lichenicola]MBB5319207.1 glucose dehydrogenase [Edaphobacter lichenicola]
MKNLHNSPIKTVISTEAVRLHRAAQWRDPRICRCLSSSCAQTASQTKTRRAIIATLLIAAALASSPLSNQRISAETRTKKHPARRTDWPVYGGQSADDHYSALHQIDRTNVHKLKVAWTFDTKEPGGLQTNPLIVGRVLFGFTPTQTVIALDAATGKNLWTFSTGTPGLQPTRGLSYWTDGTQSILFAGLLTNLYAIDPATGKLISTFGDGGKIDLRKDLNEKDVTQSFAALTTPGIVYKDMIIVGFRAPETEPALHGDIRAYDVHTGKLRWIFHTIPLPGEPGYETWPKDAWKVTGSANNWTGMALDEKRGIVYVPTGSAVNDFYGFDRIGDDLYANTLLALDANTGQRLWHFQGVHHDIWDRDFPSPPSLVTVRSHGKQIDAVAQTTKQGYLFLFDRTNGKPLFPIEERVFPASTAPGEKASPTQPIPSIPAPYARQLLTADMLTTRTPEAHAWATEQFKSFISNGLFVPFTVDKQTVVFPGFDGGAEWGGSAVDIKTGVIYINANDIVWTGGLTENKPGGSLGANVYQSQCSICHGGDRKGSPPAFPSLIDERKHLSDAQITEIIHNGKGRMPSFPNVEAARLTAVLEYLKTGDTGGSATTSAPKSANRNEIAGAKIYDKNCAICHGDDLLGAPSNYPGLLGVRLRLTDQQILANIHDGKGRMPAFHKLTAADTAALLRFLGDSAPIVESAVTSNNFSKKEVESALAPPGGLAKYRFTGYRKFLDPDGYPAVQPPWGTLNAIDLNTGRYLWKIPLGNYPELAAKGLKDTGTENYGGPIVTASGIVFIAATNFDHTLRAFDSRTGTLLWQGDLPYAGNATPATYMVDGRQYVVIATSNARNPKGPQGAAYVAFALP